jgi:hypothetical protein
MGGVFSIMSDSKAGMFRLRQAMRPWDDDGKSSSLAEKAENNARGFSLDPEFARGANAAKTAMEEAKRIAGPKSHAEDRLAKAEQRLKEIRQEARLAAARGDREKLTELAREAAQMARQAGRAAKEYASGVAAAAEMGVGGDEARSGGAGGATVLLSSTTIQTSTTTVQVRQVELSLSLTIRGGATATSGDGGAAGATGEADAGGAGLSAAGLPAATVSDAGESPTPSSSAANDPLQSLPELVGKGLAESGRSIGGFNGTEGRRLLNAMINDNELKVSRYKEADAFARRVETALGVAKSVIGEAKAANINEPDPRRRGDRRKMLDELDKELEAAHEEVDDLRGAAFGSSSDLLSGISGATGGLSAAPVASAGPVINITA